MESFGAYLKSRREERGRSLEEIADTTKIAVSNLESLEADRFDLLPPRVFVKGFIRSYVQELGLTPEEALARFDAFTREGELPDYTEEEHSVFHQKPPSGSFIRSTLFTIVLTVAGLMAISILLLTGATRLLTTDKQARGPQPVVTTVQPSGPVASVPDEEAPRPERVTTGAATSPDRAARKELKIQATATAWVRVEPDIGPQWESMMSPGEVKVFVARARFHLQTGNARGIRLWIDGHEVHLDHGSTRQALALTLP